MTKAVIVGSLISPSEKVLLPCKASFAEVKIAFVYIHVACVISCVFFTFAVLVSIIFFLCMTIFIVIPFFNFLFTHLCILLVYL